MTFKVNQRKNKKYFKSIEKEKQEVRGNFDDLFIKV